MAMLTFPVFAQARSMSYTFGHDVSHNILMNISLATFEKQIDEHVTVTQFADDNSCILKKDFSYI